MELTQLQWAKTGYVLNEDAEGKERWTNCFHNAKAVYYSESEVHPDITGAKAILSAKKKQYRLAMKERQQKIKEIVAKNKDYEEKRDEGLPLPSDALENVELPVYAGWQEAYSGNNAVVLIFDTETTGFKADYKFSFATLLASCRGRNMGSAEQKELLFQISIQSLQGGKQGYPCK